MTLKTLTLRISLEHSDPEIWREVVVTNNLTLGELHDIIQAAMGWEDDHLHMFKKNKQFFGVDQDDPWGPEIIDENQVVLSQLLTRTGSNLEYEYDFGDSWNHRIKVVATRKCDEPNFEPILLDGAMACPPEDSGGIHMYQYRMNGIAANPEDPEFEDFLEWLGEDFDPNTFDRRTIELNLASLKFPVRK